MRSILALIVLLGLIAVVRSQTPILNATNCNVQFINFFEDVAGAPGPSITQFEGNFNVIFYNRTLPSVLTSDHLWGQVVMVDDSRANYTIQVNGCPALPNPAQTWPDETPVLLSCFLTGCNVTNVVVVTTTQRADPNNFRDENCSYTYFITLRSPSTCCTGVCGDPQFKGLRGQSFQVHGIDGAIYNLISASDFSVNSQFRFLTGPRACPIIPTTGKRSVACWSHDGSYLGNLGVSTSSGEQILIESGSSQSGFATVSVDGKAVALNEVVSFSKGSIVLNSTHEITLHVGPFEIEVENNNEFLNLRSVRVAASEWHKLAENGGVHGLLGQTWQNKRYSGKIKEIQGDVDDYVIDNFDLFSHDFIHSRFVASQ